MIELISLSFMLTGAAVLAHRHQRPSQPCSILAAGAVRQSNAAADEAFVSQAAKTGIFGLLLGTLGLERSRNPLIRSFAESLILDNQNLNAELTIIIQAKKIDAHRELTPEQRSLMLHLSSLSGTAFDSRFLPAVLAEEQNAICTCLREISEGKDTELQRFASHTLPMLRRHLKLCQQAEASLTKSTAKE